MCKNKEEDDDLVGATNLQVSILYFTIDPDHVGVEGVKCVAEAETKYPASSLTREHSLDSTVHMFVREIRVIKRVDLLRRLTKL